jgi:hypothetical protein
MSDTTTRDRIAAELARHYPIAPNNDGTVICNCGDRVKADHQRQAFREHTATAILALVRDQHFTEGAELITSASLARLDEIDEDDQRPSDWERHQEWCDAANVLRTARSSGRPKRERPLVLCELPHPIAPDTWCALRIEHDGWHQDETGDRWPNDLLAARTTTKEAQR